MSLTIMDTTLFPQSLLLSHSTTLHSMARRTESPLSSVSPHMDSSQPSSVLTSPCKPIHPNVLLFIRMPKCASTSFVDLLNLLASRKSFRVLFNPGGAYNWNNVATKREAELIKYKAQKGKLVYARHFYYIDFSPHGLKDFAYVTVIREPKSRFISSYLYYHFSTKPNIQRMLKPQDKHESILECVAKEHNGCEHNMLRKYFCGHERLCSTNSSYALQVAKANMREKFAVVGILEELDKTMDVIGKILPGYFNLVEAQDSIPISNKNLKTLKSLRLEEDEAIHRANAADIELYAYARELLQSIAASCSD